MRHIDVIVGDKVEWLFEARGGWGYTWWVPATVVKVGTKRVQIDAELANGGMKRIFVKSDKLRLRA
jgi:hypothetical protein